MRLAHIRSGRGAGRRAAGALALVLAVAGCGHSSDATGPTTTSGAAAAAIDFGSNDPKTVTAFGDSITFGVLEERKRTAHLDTQNNYPNNLQKLLRQLDPTYKVLNRGLPGETVQGGASRIGGVLAADRPGIILIMEGTNNASVCDSSAFIVNNLQTMVERAKSNKTLPIIGTIPPNFRTHYCAQDVIDDANVLIRGLASAEGIVLAEIFDGMNNRSLFGITPDSDPLHPNEQGYQVMANIWFTAIKQALSGNGTTVALRPRKK